MKTLAKVALVAASLIAMGSLSACQSTTAAATTEAKPMMKADAQPMMSAEQMAAMQKEHAAQLAQIEKERAEETLLAQKYQRACDYKKPGQEIKVTIDGKTLNGTCELQFNPLLIDSSNVESPAEAKK